MPRRAFALAIAQFLIAIAFLGSSLFDLSLCASERDPFVDPVWEGLYPEEAGELRSGISSWDDAAMAEELSLKAMKEEDVKDLYAGFAEVMVVLDGSPAGAGEGGISKEAYSRADELGRKARNIYIGMSEEDKEEYGRIAALISETVYFSSAYARRYASLSPGDALRWGGIKEAATREIEREYLKVAIKAWGAGAPAGETSSENGFGSASLPDGSVYEGDFLNGLFNGKGTRTWKDGHRYEGEYKDGLPHGFGVETWSDGMRYEGEFREGKMHGKGKVFWKDGRSYEVENP